MIELERTYLAKYLPKGLEKCKSKEIIDLFIPVNFDHPKIRIRKNGDKYEITKKEPLSDDPSHMLEQTIKITPYEFAEFLKLPSKKTVKKRFLYPYKNLTAEIDVFAEDLSGLVLVDFEFETTEEKDSFKMPDFCLAEVTSEDFVAGGMVCGKKYEDIEKELERFEYKKIF